MAQTHGNLPLLERALILVKAIPHVGKENGEIVCCAGVTENREWRRLFPIRFRHLKEGKFSRWQWISYRPRPATNDARRESRRIEEDSIKPGATIPKRERAGFLSPLVLPSVSAAKEKGHSLTLIRPKTMRFFEEKKTQAEIDDERREYESAANQQSFLDEELKALEPCPYRFKLAFSTESGESFEKTCEDWETTAMFFNFSRSTRHDEVIASMSTTFNENYVRDGVVLALGTHSRFPSTWLLIGIVRLDDDSQFQLI